MVENIDDHDGYTKNYFRKKFPSIFVWRKKSKKREKSFCVNYFTNDRDLVSPTKHCKSYKSDNVLSISVCKLNLSKWWNKVYVNLVVKYCNISVYLVLTHFHVFIFYVLYLYAAIFSNMTINRFKLLSWPS